MKESENRFHKLLQEIPSVSVQGYKLDGTTCFWNQASEHLYGYTAQEAIGKNLLDLIIPSEMKDDVKQAIQKMAHTGVATPASELTLVRKDGSSISVFSSHAIVEATGREPELFCIDVDLTNTKRMEMELVQSRKMESIGNLAGGIAHDFNNILASILGFSEIALCDVTKGSAMEGHLQEIFAGGLRAKDIVKQILAFARKSDEKTKPTQVDVIVCEVLKLIRASTPATIKILKEIESSSLVMGNATQIHQILMNLCSNAVHAMEDEGGALKITLKDKIIESTIDQEKIKPGNYLELKISDTGIGIESHILENIFDPYFTTKKPGKGVGMGLALVHGIVEKYGGKIFVESTSDGKTVFTTYLPITSNLNNEIIHQPETLPKGNEHILFVDDEPAIANMGSKILELLGYRVTAKTSSIEAFELFKAKPNDFQLVITDMTIPHMTGDKLAIKLKQIRANIPIILCTGYSSKINAEIAQEIGINAFMYKPFSKADLAGTVNAVLGKKCTT
ncbi:MAG: ATP-binding protein [Desulfotalea sp.]